MTSIPKRVWYLSLAGIMPIIGATVGSFNLPFVGNLISFWLLEAGILFSALILAFLGGCIFIFEILPKAEPDLKGLCIAFLPPLWALIAVLMPASGFLLAVGYLLTLERERIMHRSGLLPAWWLKMRFRLTTLMTILLIIIGFNA